ncbi:MAG: enoyl-CoA hydratase-related protein, partial [Pseudomonadales bacterium]
MPEQDLVMLERREGWAEIAINRPERRNSIIPPVSVAIADALDEVADDEDIACVLLRGEGGYFCSGV